MKSRVGLWIDHSDAKIVMLETDPNGSGRIAVITKALSRVEKHGRFSRGSAEDGSVEYQRVQQFQFDLNTYYDDVITHLCKADSMVIFGPGEAKSELLQRLAVVSLNHRDVIVETVHKFTDHQITSKVLDHFQAER